MFGKMVFAGIGGIAGALLRYLILLEGEKIVQTDFPVVVLLINLLGCFMLGWLTGFVFQHLSSHLSTLIGTGLIGSLTTFSTVSMDFIRLLQQGYWLFAGLDLLISCTGGLFMAWLGYHMGNASERRHGQQ